MEQVVFRGDEKRMEMEVEMGWSNVGFVPSGMLWPLFTMMLLMCVWISSEGLICKLAAIPIHPR
jgi:hypothetical protein